MHHTPWTKKGSASSLTSDRLRPRTQPSPAPKKSAPGKDKEKPPPRSKAVRALDALLAALRAPAPPPATPCYCQARRHALSPHTPLCTHCGLVLCALHPPPAPCPSCAAPLLTPAARSALIARLEAERADVLAGEEEARLRAREEKAAAAGAFPALPGAAAQARQGPQVHKVLSLDAKTKRATLASYGAARPRSAGPPGEEDDEAERVERVPAPPDEVPHVDAPRAGARWADLRAGGPGAVYVAAPGGGSAGSASRGR